MTIPVFCAQHPGSPCLHLVGDRFTVVIDSAASTSAARTGVNLKAVVDQALTHISLLLPGPPSDIAVSLGGISVIREVGVGGLTNPATGQVSITLGPRSDIPFSQSLRVWLPRALSHEVDHSVRILAGPGINDTLLSAFAFEGLADAFDQQAAPDRQNPWDQALPPEQERSLWTAAKPVLTTSDPTAYQRWFFGGPGIPRWAGFTIGYHMVASYLRQHPGQTAAAIVQLPAQALLDGSGYTP
jgi:hypothetical protein